MSRGTIIAAAALLVGCSDYEFESTLGGEHGVEQSTTGPGDVATPDDGTWEGGEDPGTEPSGGGSGAIRPDDPLHPPDEGDDEGDPSDPNPPGDPLDPGDPGDGLGRMTGGGSLWHGDERVTHGFTLRCDPSHPANRLQINWGNGDKFHLTELTSVACWDDPSLDPLPRPSDFDTLWAAGFGRLNGEDGVAIEILFTDGGEPGTRDEGWIAIDRGLVLDVGSTVERGNHQAHGAPNMPAPAGPIPTSAELEAAGLALPEAEPTAGGCSTVPTAAGGWLALVSLLGLRRR